MRRFLILRTFFCLLALCTSVSQADYLADKMLEFGLQEVEPEADDYASDPFQQNAQPDTYYVDWENGLQVKKLDPWFENWRDSRNEKNKKTTPGDTVELSEEDLYDGTLIEFKTNKVRYVGADRGEWGGGLYLDRYEKEKEPLMWGNIRALIPVGDDLYVIEGLAHLGLSSGSIHAIRDYQTPSPPEQVTLLPDAPEVVIIEEHGDEVRFVIVGASSLMVFEPDNSLQLVHFDTFWGSHYPTSIKKLGEYYLIGMRGGVAATVINPHSKSTIRFFKPEKAIPQTPK